MQRGREYGYSDFELLITKGSPLDAQDDAGKTTLMYAAGWGHAKTAEALIKAGASKIVRDNAGNTAEDHARKHGKTKLYDLLRP